MSLSRRGTLALGAGWLTATVVDLPAWAMPADADAEIAKFTGGKGAEPGPISIDLPTRSTSARPSAAASPT